MSSNEWNKSCTSCHSTCESLVESNRLGKWNGSPWQWLCWYDAFRLKIKHSTIAAQLNSSQSADYMDTVPVGRWPHSVCHSVSSCLIEFWGLKLSKTVYSDHKLISRANVLIKAKHENRTARNISVLWYQLLPPMIN